MRYSILPFTLALTLALGACGQTGPLVHPEEAQRKEQERKEKQKRELGAPPAATTPAPTPTTETPTTPAEKQTPVTQPTDQP